MTTLTTERPIADRIEEALIAADLLAHRLYGPDENVWTDTQWADYEQALATARREVTP